MGSTSGPGAVVNIANEGGWLPCPSRQMPAIAVIADPLSVNRCLAFGYALPVNSKNAEAGIRQRLLSLKLRPSERKLKIGFPADRAGGKLKVIGRSSIRLPVAHITGPTSLMRMSSARGR